MSTNYLNTCRICAKQSTDTCDLFSNEHDGKKLIDLLRFCVQISVYKNDGLPTNICNECSSKLISTHEFHTLCWISDQHFRKNLLFSHVDPTKLESDNFPEPLAKVEAVYEPDNCDREIKLENENEENERSYSVNALIFESETDSKFVEKRKPCTTKKRKRTKQKRAHKKEKRIRVREPRVKREIDFYECIECKLTFKQYQQLRNHQKDHSSEPSTKPFECNYCQMQFAHGQSLIRHKRKHTKNIYECEYCQHAFAELVQLKEHLDMHKEKNELKTYKCELCSRKFPMSFQLANHMVVNHVDTKRFDCTYCNDSFVTVRLLKSHIREVHTSKNPICDSLFFYRKLK